VSVPKEKFETNEKIISDISKATWVAGNSQYKKLSKHKIKALGIAEPLAITTICEIIY
jgi:hypothetical protein